jgi:hypothetical protein
VADSRGVELPERPAVTFIPNVTGRLPQKQLKDNCSQHSVSYVIRSGR